MQLADMICGNFQSEESFFVYRSSKYLTEFFADVETDYEHDGSTRQTWVADTLEEIMKGPQSSPNAPPATFARVIDRLMDPADALNESEERKGALAQLNVALAGEGFEVFHAPDKKWYLRHLGSNTLSGPSPNPHRPFSATEIERRNRLLAYLDTCSEDELIEETAAAVPAAWFPPYNCSWSQGQGSGVRQGRLDEVHITDTARGVLWDPGEEGQARLVRDEQSW